MFLVIQWCFWFTANAFAAPRLIMPPAPSNQVQADFWMQMHKLFAQEGRIQLIESQAVQQYFKEAQQSSNATDAAVDPNAEKKADDLLSSGWDDFKNLRLDTAIEKLEKAKLQFRELLPVTVNSKKLLTAYLHFGIALITNGEKTRGEQELKDMIVLDPSRSSRKLNPKYYTPEIIATYDALRKEIINNAAAKLAFEVTPNDLPANSKIWFDGAEVTGLLVENIPEGEHFVAIQAPGFRNFFSKKFIVPGNNQISISLERILPNNIESYFAPIRSAYDLPQETVSFLDGMSVKLSGDIILFYRLSMSGNGQVSSLEAQLYDQRSQETSSIESAAVTGNSDIIAPSQKVVKALLEQIDNRGYVVSKLLQSQTAANSNVDSTLPSSLNYNPAQAAKNANRNANSTPWYKKWWVYAIAAGTVGAVAGGVLLFSDSGSSTSTLVIDNPSN